MLEIKYGLHNMTNLLLDPMGKVFKKYSYLKTRWNVSWMVFFQMYVFV
jgi:hypothetical protein